ncbi:hypothetical protein PFLUV_G00248530 [Perca fluviatilis]|uniref:Uncharacterized protein n=1 Tax=Perca fluviatilis TaxID=8168 RepID=A0A6A5E6M7_PERFL|nr:hypothetical protein PFLUV_G00248530 [Perca fluviatilis]
MMLTKTPLCLPVRRDSMQAVKSSARSRARRKRLLEARQNVLDGLCDLPPFFPFTELCATLQSRLELIQKYRATHHRRLPN